MEILLIDEFKGPALNVNTHCYPVWDDEMLCRELQVKSSDRVLDVGGGHQPFSRADVIVDLSFATSEHRGGNEAVRGEEQEWVEANIEDLPFCDNSFDFVYCTHVLEHVGNPEKACRELMRVASRGFLEVPRKFTEYLAGYPAHQWLIDWVDDELIFEARTFLETPLASFGHSMILNDPEFAERTEKRWRHLFNVQLYWQAPFAFKVIDSADRINLSDDNVKGRAYLDFSRNQLRWKAPASYALSEAEIAVTLLPDDSLAWHVAAVYRALNGKCELANSAFRKAQSLAGADVSLQRNAELWFGEGSLREEGVVPGTDFSLV